MKKISLSFLIVAGVCVVLALISHFFFSGRIFFQWDKFIEAAIIFLLASCAVSLLALIDRPR